ncbi:MAG TPA: hypothetical protein VK988_11650 [Acidimicrobiales bacterium]|nr:hypothetical protein [Acidimicrobiales bacterium]
MTKNSSTNGTGVNNGAFVKVPLDVVLGNGHWSDSAHDEARMNPACRRFLMSLPALRRRRRDRALNITATELAEHLGVSSREVWRWIGTAGAWIAPVGRPLRKIELSDELHHPERWAKVPAAIVLDRSLAPQDVIIVAYALWSEYDSAKTWRETPTAIPLREFAEVLGHKLQPVKPGKPARGEKNAGRWVNKAVASGRLKRIEGRPHSYVVLP